MTKIWAMSNKIIFSKLYKILGPGLLNSQSFYFAEARKRASLHSQSWCLLLAICGLRKAYKYLKMVEEIRKLGNAYKKYCCKNVKKSLSLAILIITDHQQHMQVVVGKIYNHHHDLQFYLTIRFLNLLPIWLKQLS